MKKKIKIFGIPIVTIEETRATVSAETDSSNPAPWLYDALGGLQTSTGISITSENALQFSAVYACMMVIADQIASFPKNVFKIVNDKERERYNNHPAQILINDEPNGYYSAFDLWHAVVISVLGWGNGFVRILRDAMYEPVELFFIPASKIKIYYGYLENELVLFYEYIETGEKIPARDMLHFKGMSFDAVQGKSVITSFAKESIGLSIASEQFGAKFFGNDTLMTKYLAHPGILSENAQKRLQNSWQTQNAGLEQAFKIKILEEGMELKSIGIPPEQAQFIATRQHQVEEICRWFKVQPHLIQHLLRSTNNNIEHQGIEFVTQTLTPWVVRFEKELKRKLIKNKRLYVKMNMNALLRGDVKARGEYYTKMANIGVLSPNEIRELEDMNPREGGDQYMTPLNMSTNNKENGTDDQEE